MAMENMDIECLHFLKFKCRLNLYMIHSRRIVRKAVKPVAQMDKKWSYFPSC